jgi:hypothetical protein
MHGPYATYRTQRGPSVASFQAGPEFQGRDRRKGEPVSSGPSDPSVSGGREGDEPEGETPSRLGARLRKDGVEHAQLMAGVRLPLGEDRRVEVRPVGRHHFKAAASSGRGAAVDAEGAAEPLPHRAAVADHVEPLDLAVEAVVDEPVGEVEVEILPHRGEGPFDAHAVLEDAVEYRLAHFVVVERPGSRPGEPQPHRARYSP